MKTQINNVIKKAIKTTPVTGIKKVANVATVKKETQYVKLHKDKAVAESKEAVLLEIKDINVGINKKGIYTSEYTNLLNIGIVVEGTYNYSDVNGNQSEISGQELLNYILN